MPDEEKDKAGLLAKKLHHFRKVLRRAAKKARTFETAKLVKKCKALRKDGDAGSGSGVKDDVKKQLEVLEKDMKAMKVDILIRITSHKGMETYYFSRVIPFRHSSSTTLAMKLFPKPLPRAPNLPSTL